MIGDYIDLRSDTVTLPKIEMIEAIANATLGDDIMGEDVTVHELERISADLLGMEDAILVLSGTMANQIAMMGYSSRGEEVILGAESHIYNLEGAAMAAVAQVQGRPIHVPNGYFDPEVVESAISKGDMQRAKTALIALENTYNLNLGQIVSLENMKEIQDVAKQYNLPVYMDGARLFNATAELGVAPSEFCKYVDAVQFCLTKGLGCPLGSILAGNKEFIAKAKQNRQRLGGGMRQAGIIAAPGIYALENMLGRLKEDNNRARELAKRLAGIDGISINAENVQTNIISAEIRHHDMDAELIINRLREKKIKVKKIEPNRIRMVVHYSITDAAVDYVEAMFRNVFEERLSR